MKTFIRTKSGRVREKLVYVNRKDYDRLKAGGMDSDEMAKVLRKYANAAEGETVDGWGEAQVKQVSNGCLTK